MSGVYIPGIEMPKTWRDCAWSNGAAQCKLDNMELCGLCYQRCPLIPVPDHGRLIDADDLYEACALDPCIDVMASAKRINEYMQLKIDDAPIVIPPSGGQEDE